MAAQIRLCHKSSLACPEAWRPVNRRTWRGLLLATAIGLAGAPLPASAHDWHGQLEVESLSLANFNAVIAAARTLVKGSPEIVCGAVDAAPAGLSMPVTRALGETAARLPPAAFDAWFRPLHAVEALRHPDLPDPRRHQALHWYEMIASLEARLVAGVPDGGTVVHVPGPETAEGRALATEWAGLTDLLEATCAKPADDDTGS